MKLVCPCLHILFGVCRHKHDKTTDCQKSLKNETIWAVKGSTYDCYAYLNMLKGSAGKGKKVSVFEFSEWSMFTDLLNFHFGVPSTWSVHYYFQHNSCYNKCNGSM